MRFKKSQPCAPMRAAEGEPRLRAHLNRCQACADYLVRRECLDVVVRLTQWLEPAAPALSRRLKKDRRR